MAGRQHNMRNAVFRLGANALLDKNKQLATPGSHFLKIRIQFF